ncbi:MAG TPA: 2-aminoethylphosphonate--pyruvate transaminase [Methylomirabilota bacterium]|nr:2-aminoethylphosphonate--pyruvate transaminase [Methylomirabilota bacterium]
MSPPDKRLFTPGPLTTSRTVKEAMLHDVGSRDTAFLSLVRDIRRQLLELGRAAPPHPYETILMQGSGTFGVESVLSTVVPDTGRLLILANGAYGERMARIAARLRLPHEVLHTPENVPPAADTVCRRLADRPTFTHLAMVHCETTTGILNPVEPIGRLARESGITFIVDAMSSFGALPLDLPAMGIDFLVSSANKCIEGVPGFSFILAQRDKLAACAGQSRGLSLDLHEQWSGFESNGQFRFTPPTHALLAFDQALRELADEGGVAGRVARYQANHRALFDGMSRLGFRAFLPRQHQSPIITTFLEPGDPRFQFEEFYERLSRHGHLIYPGKLGQGAGFRIGNIGRLDESDIQALLTAVTAVLKEMNLPIPVPAPAPAPA